MRKKKRKKHTKIITKIVLFSGILIGGGIGIVTIMNYNVPEKRLNERDADASQACLLVLTYFMDPQ